jgi:hypothetical protein
LEVGVALWHYDVEEDLEAEDLAEEDCVSLTSVMLEESGISTGRPAFADGDAAMLESDVRP